MAAGRGSLGSSISEVVAAFLGQSGWRNRGFVGTRLPPSKRRRSGQCSLLVCSGGEACLPTTTRCGMAQHRERFAGISAFLLRLWDGSGLISPVTHRCLASSSFRARGYVYSQADFFVGTGNAISFPRFSPAPSHSHPHWQQTESHNRGFSRSALHTAHDLIHMVLLHRESDRDLDALIATGLSFDCQTIVCTSPV